MIVLNTGFKMTGRKDLFGTRETEAPAWTGASSLAELPIRLFGTADDSIVDGPGIRFAVFAQGCGRHCPGCHNPQSQPYEGGYTASVDALMSAVKANPLLSGVTLSGGEPFDQAAALLPFVSRLRFEQPDLNIWAFSGYCYEDLDNSLAGEAARDLLFMIDVLVDGPYVEALRTLELAWRGSTNQRLVNVTASKASGYVIEI
jgi:anaerobic ribonucleoside-triphosphate reductase activating protein